MESNKNEYKKPELVKHGSLKEITQKITGGIDGDGPNHQASMG